VLGIVVVAAAVAWARTSPSSASEFPLTFVDEDTLRETNGVVVKRAGGAAGVSVEDAGEMYLRDFAGTAGEVKQIVLAEVSYESGEFVCRCLVVVAHPTEITVDGPAALTPRQKEERRKTREEIFAKPSLYRVVGIDAETGEYRALAEGY
jgi:hypothetical protein